MEHTSHIMRPNHRVFWQRVHHGRNFLGKQLISLGSLFNREPAPLLGVDVSSSSVKLVELGRDRDGGLVLQHCAIEPLERGWINDGNIEKFDEVAEALRRVVRKSGSKTKHVAMALPGSAVITKKLHLPAGLSDAEMELQVESEAANYIPFPLAEVALDFCVLGPAPQLPDHVEVFLAASRKEKVSDRQGVAEAAALTPVVLDAEPYAARLAASRFLDAPSGQTPPPLHALFEVGSQSTSLQVMRHDEMIYERDQAFGGQQLTSHIARQYGISQEEAEMRKKTGTGLPADYAQAVLKPFMDGLGQEIGRALQFFFTSTPHNKVDQVFLCGGSAALPGLAQAVTAQTGFPCKVLNPFEGMRMAPGLAAGKLAVESTSYLVATGLALRRFYP